MRAICKGVIGLTAIPARTIRSAAAVVVCASLAAAMTQATQTTPLAAAQTPAQTMTSKMVSAANAFLATLDESQRQRVLFPFDDDRQRARWSNLPTAFVPRGGIALGELSAAQRSAALALVAAGLSRRGFEKIEQIVQGDEVLRISQGNNPNFGKDLYYLSLLGKPSEKNPWMLQFGGHHLALNVTVAAERGVLTPTLTGAQPALYTSNDKTVRPLGAESDKALALLQSLDEPQRRQAILSYRLADLVLGPGEDGKTIQPEGLKASAMSERQRALLLEVMAQWAGIIDESDAAARMAELKADIGDTWFAWSGPVTASPGRNITAYYRIQGPHVVIEYAPQRLGGDPSMHVHTMYRDPTNDYGRRLTGR
jgi:Protein of unknown function (DUF3500)